MVSDKEIQMSRFGSDISEGKVTSKKKSGGKYKPFLMVPHTVVVVNELDLEDHY